MITRNEMKIAVETVANVLASRIGRITTLELKNELRKTYPAVMWNQYDGNGVSGVSNLFHELVYEGKFYSVADNGTYQTYQPKTSVNNLVAQITKANSKRRVKTPVAATSKPKAAIKAAVKKVTGSKVSKSTALNMILNAKGQFVGATWIKQDGSTRTANAHILPKASQKDLNMGYILAKDTNKARKNPADSIVRINIQTLKNFKIAGNTYKV